MAEERIQKIMAEQGLCSRRAAEQIIAEGRVKVNGHPVKVGDKMAGRHGNKGDEAAATAINMVKLQIDMEAASPDHEPDRRNIN